MFTLFEGTGQRVPIKVWLPGKEDLDEGSYRQALNLARLPFAFHHIALMPDTHEGYGMPIGGVLATEGVIIPNAVGVDIGCGVSFIHTDIPASVVRETPAVDGSLAEELVQEVLHAVPTGFAKHKRAQSSRVLDRAAQYLRQAKSRNDVISSGLKAEVKNAYQQIGTLGGGNHFIELQRDEDGKLAIMIHCGSRHFGYTIAKCFNELARSLRDRWGSRVPAEYQLDYLPVDSREGRAYIRWMNFALDFAKENRAVITRRVKEIVFRGIRKYAGIKNINIDMELDVHHNYAALERHFGREVWAHRKGAIRAGKGELGVIPGAMGSRSYIVRGLGNPESFQTCSHGAGRVMSRNQALKQFSTAEVLADLKEKGVVLGKQNKKKVADECIWAYKDVSDVVKNQLDLIEPIMVLETIAVIKG